MSRGWLIVFAKAPRPGLVKTRLCPPLSLEESAVFYEEMLLDVLETSGRIARERDLEAILAFHPPDAANELIRLAPPGFRLQNQRGADLAERMANAFAEAAAAGVPWALLRGSDSPALSPAHVDQAIEALEHEADLVLTPDEGGGYAMIGMGAPCPALFALPMSTSDMLSNTLVMAKQQGLDVAMTDATFDLDVAADFEAFARYSEAELSDLCPRTVESISVLRASRVL